MANNSGRPVRFPSMKRVAQINSYYCGPATLQMLLSFLEIEMDQERVVKILKNEKRIKTQGITFEEMDEFVRREYPGIEFWYKFNATIKDLSWLVNKCQYPVGIEWQGIFDYPDEEVLEDEDDDPGHISVVTAIDTASNFVYLSDPDVHYAGKDRKLSILQFERRWWDINETVDPVTRKHQEVDDYHGLFVISPKEQKFPAELHLQKFTK